MASISKGITVYGRLSFPVWSFKDAVERNKKSDYPKTDESTVTPEFHLLLDQVQLNKFKTYVTDVFFPDLLARKAAGETKNALDQAQVDRLRDEFGIYAVGSGRICVAALNHGNIDYVADAIAAVHKG